MGFIAHRQVRFAHVDAAAIVFYPRYFEMLNAAVEDWFAAMGSDFSTLHKTDGIGTPTVRLDCQFIAPASLGDLLAIELSPLEVGRSSCEFAFRFSVDGANRLCGSAVLVCMDLTAQRAMAWPEHLRAGMIAGGARPKD